MLTEPLHQLLAALASGVIAGLTIAMPLGAIGIMVLTHAMQHGARVAAGAGLGVALVDGMYAALATVATSWALAVAAYERSLRMAAAGVLVAMATWGLWQGWRSWQRAREHQTCVDQVQDAASGVAELDPPLNLAGQAPKTSALVAPPLSSRPLSARGAVLKFFAITALNPVTLLYFLALSVSLPAGAVGHPWAFVAGVGSGSLGWYLVLAGLGSLGNRATPEFQATSSLVGWGVIGGFGLALLISAVI